MHSYPNARLTPIGRERLICSHLDDGVPLKALAAEAGIGFRSAYKWLARFVLAVWRHWPIDGLFAAPSGARSVDPQRLQQAVDLRHQRCTLRRIAKALMASLSTAGRVMNALGLCRLRNLEPKNPVQRYQWERPGAMIHGDT